MHFREFVPKYLDGSIREDMTWRAYDIERMAGAPVKVKNALKHLGYIRTEHTLDQVAHDYTLKHATQAKQLLALWWTWYEIATGIRTIGVLRSS